MRLRTTYIATAALVLAVGVNTPVVGQQNERDERRRERQLEAAEEAMRALQEAIDELRASRTEQAQEQLEDALRALRRAEAGLDLANRLRVLAPGASLFDDGMRNFTLMVSRPRMGVEVRSRTDADTEAVGAEILRVTPDSPAEEAGLEAGDIITRVNGEDLARSGRRGREPGSKLIEVIRELEVGDTVQVEYQRDGQTRTTSVVLRELDNEFAYSLVTPDVSRDFSVRVPDVEVIAPRIAQGAQLFSRLLQHGWLNMELVTLNEALGEYFGTTEGLLVLQGPDDDAIDVRGGDVILSIDGRKPTSPSHAMRIIRSYDEGESFELEIMRQRRRMTVSGVVPDRDGDVFMRERRDRREW